MVAFLRLLFPLVGFLLAASKASRLALWLPGGHHDRLSLLTVSFLFSSLSGSFGLASAIFLQRFDGSDLLLCHLSFFRGQGRGAF